MGIITVDAAPDFAVEDLRYTLASRPSADVAPGFRRPADMLPVMKVDGEPKKAFAWPASRRAPTVAQKVRHMACTTVVAVAWRVGRACCAVESGEGGLRVPSISV